MGIGKNIRKIRINLNRSQESVVYRLENVSQSTLSNIETEKKEVTLDTPEIQMIADELGVSIYDFLNTEVKDPYNTSQPIAISNNEKRNLDQAIIDGLHTTVMLLSESIKKLQYAIEPLLEKRENITQ
jgi:transcriptional regulator with XRE-family HTH domain